MVDKFDISGYARISDEEDPYQDRNVSIEHQKKIISAFVEEHFPGSTLTFYEDRDKSGYTFEQRDGYQRMRKELFSGKKQILIINEFSRFSRRNSRGLVELEDLRDAGVRIISIGDAVDYPNQDDWMKIQVQFLVNEMPVTTSSRKVRNVVLHRQIEGSWICNAPYGYITNKECESGFEVVPIEAEIVRRIFKMYIDGFGYKRIANTLTEEKIPTPRMMQADRIEADGRKYHGTPKTAWNGVSIQGILTNDFYIGTFRQRKYSRKKINGVDVKNDASEHIVFENHHQAIIDYRTFAQAQEQIQKRQKYNYRGTKKYDNFYTGFLFCGDCGSPMFAMSKPTLREAYRCGEYHKRGLKGCTSSHHIRTDRLDELLKDYVRLVKDNSSAMLAELDAGLAAEKENINETEQRIINLNATLESKEAELKALLRRRAIDLVKYPEREDLLNETYDEMEANLLSHIAGIRKQIDDSADKRNLIIQVNRSVKTALDVFDDILSKDKLNRNDIDLIIDKIDVFEDRIDIHLKDDIDHLLRTGLLPQKEEELVNFKQGTEDILQTQLVQSAVHHKDKVFCVNVVKSGDPLEIYTDKEGGVIFRKYSLMDGLSDFSAQMCETLSKTTGHIAAITDRDTCLSAAGCARRELADKHVSPALEEIMEHRQIYQFDGSGTPVTVTEEGDKYLVSAAAPILSEGDVLGCVLFAVTDPEKRTGEIEYKLVQTVAGFLGRHMES